MVADFVKFTSSHYVGSVFKEKIYSDFVYISSIILEISDFVVFCLVFDWIIFNVWPSLKLPHVWAVIASWYKGIPTSLSITSLGTPASQKHIKINPVCPGIEFPSNLYVDLMKCSKSTINCSPCCDDWFNCPGFNDVMTSESSSIKGVRVVVPFRVCKLNLNVNWIVDVSFHGNFYSYILFKLSFRSLEMNLIQICNC